jgi:uncharacterized protein DUF4272
MGRSISKIRWEKLRQRMIVYGIQDVPLTAIPENITSIVKDPEEAAARLLILLSIAFSASNASETDKIADWLKHEEIWPAASENEKFFLRENGVQDEERAKLSFRFEGAYMLAWTLGLVPDPPDPAAECDAELVGDFFANVPPLLAPADELFDDAGFERINTVHDEYLFYLMALLYFKHIRVTDKENTSNVHEAVAIERYMVLEWLFNDQDPDWDEVPAILQEDDESAY